MNKLIIALVLIFTNQVLQAQLQGLSASKLSTLNVTCVAKHQAEFEPTFSSSYTKQNVAGLGETLTVSSSLNWRITLGLLDKLELGLNFPSDVSTGSLSLKAEVYNKGALQLGVMGGITSPLDNRTYLPSRRTINDVTTYGLGIIGSIAIDSVTSIDLNVQLADYFGEVPFNPITGDDATSQSFYFNANVGTYVTDKILLLAGGGYQTFQDYWNANLFVEYGFALEWNPRYIFVVSGFNSVWTNNTLKSSGFNLSFTTLW